MLPKPPSWWISRTYRRSNEKKDLAKCTGLSILKLVKREGFVFWREMKTAASKLTVSYLHSELVRGKCRAISELVLIYLVSTDL